MTLSPRQAYATRLLPTRASVPTSLLREKKKTRSRSIPPLSPATTTALNCCSSSHCPPRIWYPSPTSFLLAIRLFDPGGCVLRQATRSRGTAYEHGGGSEPTKTRVHVGLVRRNNS